MKAWMPLFRMYELQPETTWEAFRMEYEDELGNLKEALNKFTKTDLKK